MNIEQLFLAFLNGHRDIVPEAMRIELIRQVMGGKKLAVAYIKGQTYCPVCRRFGIIDCCQVTVIRTTPDVRYLECKRCGCNFTAIESEKESVAVAETKEDLKPVKAKKRKNKSTKKSKSK